MKSTLKLDTFFALGTLFLALLLTSFLPSAAQAMQTENEIRVMLQERDREIKALLGPDGDVPDDRQEALRDVVNEVIDFRAMGEGALGPHWAGLSTADQDEFVSVFSEIVRRQSLSNLDIYRSDVTYGDITVNGSTARAVTFAKYRDVSATVEYDLEYRDGEWFITDIILDDVGTVEGFARSFQSVIRKRGFDSLMTSLNKKLDSFHST